MRHQLFHINSVSSKIVFRDEEDYIRAINRLASCAHSTGTRVWAYSIMSTHFHLVVSSPDVKRFIRFYSYNISRGHNHKYQADVHMKITKRKLSDEYEITSAVNYVLKNPMHHGIAETAFSYPYSSTHCYFPEDLTKSESYSGERTEGRSQSAAELGGRVLRTLFGRQKVPASLKVSDGVMVVPESFIEHAKVNLLYKSPRKFLFQMTKPLAEELNMFEDSSQVAENAQNRISLFGKKTDIEVCRIIDSGIAPKPYTQITHQEREDLWRILQKQGVGWGQFIRAI